MARWPWDTGRAYTTEYPILPPSGKGIRETGPPREFGYMGEKIAGRYNFGGKPHLFREADVHI